MTEQTDEQVLASLLGKFIDDTAYYCWGLHHDEQSGSLTLDGTITLTTDEIAAIERATGRDGQDWWDGRRR